MLRTRRSLLVACKKKKKMFKKRKIWNKEIKLNMAGLKKTIVRL